MPIPSGVHWKQHYNDQINTLVEIRDAISAIERFNDAGEDFHALPQETRDRIVARVTSRFNAVRSELVDIRNYLATPPPPAPPRGPLPPQP